MNFCVTDGESVVATRYISSRHDEAASLVKDVQNNQFYSLKTFAVVFIRHDFQRVHARWTLQDDKGGQAGKHHHGRSHIVCACTS